MQYIKKNLYLALSEYLVSSQPKDTKESHLPQSHLCDGHCCLLPRRRQGWSGHVVTVPTLCLTPGRTDWWALGAGSRRNAKRPARPREGLPRERPSVVATAKPGRRLPRGHAQGGRHHQNPSQKKVLSCLRPCGDQSRCEGPARGQACCVGAERDEWREEGSKGESDALSLQRAPGVRSHVVLKAAARRLDFTLARMGGFGGLNRGAPGLTCVFERSLQPQVEEGLWG